MDLGGIMLGELSQKEKTLYGLHLYVEFKKTYKNQICRYQSRG